MFKVADTIQLKVMKEYSEPEPSIQRLLRLIAGVILTFLGFFILLNRNFKDHPFPVMGISCLAMAARLLMMESLRFIVLLSNPSWLSYLLLSSPLTYLFYGIGDEKYKDAKEKTVDFF